jgi:hypothetical protein
MRRIYSAIVLRDIEVIVIRYLRTQMASSFVVIPAPSVADSWGAFQEVASLNPRWRVGVMTPLAFALWRGRRRTLRSDALAEIHDGSSRTKAARVGGRRPADDPGLGSEVQHGPSRRTPARDGRLAFEVDLEWLWPNWPGS